LRRGEATTESQFMRFISRHTLLVIVVANLLMYRRSDRSTSTSNSRTTTSHGGVSRAPEVFLIALDRSLGSTLENDFLTGEFVPFEIGNDTVCRCDFPRL